MRDWLTTNQGFLRRDDLHKPLLKHPGPRQRVNLVGGVELIGLFQRGDVLPKQFLQLRDVAVVERLDGDLCATPNPPPERALVQAHFRAELLVDHAARHSGEGVGTRSEEHTSELQSRENLVCRLLLEKKKKDGRAR